MSRPPGALSYAAVLRTPGARRAFTAATLARLSYGTITLSLLLTVQTATASFGTAGIALAAYGVPTVLLPLKSRAIDRYGRRRVLIPLGTCYSLVLGLIVATAAARVQAAVPYVVLSVSAGLLAPPVGPIMRTIWASLTPDPAARQRAYALDAVVEETVFAISPLIVGVVLAVTEPLVALVATAVLALAGALGLAASPLSQQASHGAGAGPDRRAALSPLRSPQLRWVLLVMFAVGVGLSPLELAVAARATQVGHPAAAGYLLAALSVGSATGGLLWGRRQHRHSYIHQLLALLLALAIGTIVAGLTPNLPALAVALAVTGLAVAPLFVAAYLAADRSAPPPMRTEATTWVATASNFGGSAGAAAAGFLIDRTGPTATLLLAGTGLAISVVALAAPQARRRRTSQRPTHYDAQ